MVILLFWQLRANPLFYEMVQSDDEGVADQCQNLFNVIHLFTKTFAVVINQIAILILFGPSGFASVNLCLVSCRGFIDA
ncbi:hypothetical protein LK12_00525 [Novosphingobium malaysiense]|uniref:Uncharacterized protein n=1 Tax=Novosphingobium malaysiense TaxID=1348853 RepID=A0A0B1ZUW0_9SPHN|nr:hypothetical protein LK12_00525 [Novosphingobium malaysiense]